MNKLTRIKRNNVIIVIVITLIMIVIGVYIAINKDNGSDIPKGEKLAPSNELTDRQWTWAWTRMSDGRNIISRQKDAFTITFDEDGRFSGTTDCNSFGGQYDIKENYIIFSQIFFTEMYCENSQEFDFTGALSEVDKFMFDEDGNLILLLKFDSGSIILNDKNSEYNSQKWELIKQAISECKVKDGGQAHSREVTVKLKNGEEIKAFAPQIDNIFHIAQEAEDECGQIMLWTE
jgi:heat shock protein HslJ